MRSATTRLAYGSRGRLRGTDSGVRRVAPTFGKARFTTFSNKAAGVLAVESGAEQLVVDVLSIDPTIRRFAAQPFAVDLIERRILRTPEAIKEARTRHRDRPGPRFYTPDFAAECFDLPEVILEVKSEGFEGDEGYGEKLSLAQSVLEASGYRFWRLVVPADPWSPARINVGALAHAALRTDLWPTPEQIAALEVACGTQGNTLGAVCEAVKMSTNLAPAWLVSGVLEANLLRDLINVDLPVRIAQEDLSHLALLEELCA
ncbi:hypothetical protein [uncultured Ramlibacter sp.]|uniref:hypothetical protein n=1 Tax=uncultured Ramlibacter sp. TaxID=260755 RepID=UPI00260EF44F|nr:hypothetical protein [uncultured Ramlibacter sp.]